MKPLLLPLLLSPLILSAHAQQVEWTASGSVTSVSGSGFAAAVTAPVSVKFSYSLVSTYQPLTGIINIADKGEFFGDIGLNMEVSIAGDTWKGTVPNSPAHGTYALLVDALMPSAAPDIFTVTASSADTGVFSPFPYTGSSSARSIQVVLRDDTVPSHLLALGVLPDATTQVSAITSGSGSVSAGSDRISFSIDPASVTVSSIEPKIPLTITRTLSGIELRWPSETGTTYKLQENAGLSLAGWTLVDDYPGTGEEIVVPLTPFALNPERRFYRVITE
ncbi:hypothetical protein OKA04_03550 [Luteolibacter flavescens]|uniref:Lamin tail domain-containing protein n=1 Tax=Luteolibacter flavescens TaxID=1859460 RepID=A0ABT3FJP5_9BACT|nr:hypothetical protein [Luteolibacter flavescens]MCW1883788.1 hypothetical protein [Luteolibacter flavescens]